MVEVVAIPAGYGDPFPLSLSIDPSLHASHALLIFSSPFSVFVAYVGAACAVIGLVQLYLGLYSIASLFTCLGSKVMKERKRIYTSDSFLKQSAVKALEEDHKKAFGSSINNLGYPDMGNGRYSKLIPYEDWVRFNNVQRCHYNMVETSGPVLATMIVGGFFNPILCSSLGLAYAIGMILFSIGYTSKKGADGRSLGAVLRTISSLLLFLFCLYHASGLLTQLLFDSLLESIRVMEDED